VAGGGRARVPLVKARAAEMRLAAQEALKVARAVRAPVPYCRLSRINDSS
jgi:hypothetical protein